MCPRSAPVDMASQPGVTIMQKNDLAKIAAINIAAFCFGAGGFAQMGLGGAGGRLETAPVAQSRANFGPDSNVLRNSDRAWNQARISPWLQNTERSSVRALDDLKGTTMTGTDGEELGKLDDLLVESGSGRLVGVVVSSGGVLGVGSELRVVSVDQLRPTGGDGDLQVTIAKTDFQALAVATEEDLNRGAAALLPSGNSSTAGASDEATRGSERQNHVVRAGTLKGKDVRAGDREAGEVDDVAVNFEHRRAMTIVEADNDFADGGGKFVVPFDRLDIGSNDSDSVGANLSSSDFASQQETGLASAQRDRDAIGRVDAQSSARATDRPGRADVGRDVPPVAANAEWSRDRQDADRGAAPASSRAAPPVDYGVARDPEKLTPTGHSSGLSAREHAELARDARGIRSALDNHATLAGSDVRVLPEDGKIILKGSVANNEAKQRIEQLARSSGTKAEIENQITVREQ